MNGYTGKLLHIDLGDQKIWVEDLNLDFAREYIGGSGLAAHYLYERIDHQTDPLGSENTLVFMTGPLVGTAMPSAGRYSVCALSPLTGIWGEANSGGFFGPELRFSGYDGIFITGKAEKPSWLSIVAGKAQLHDASGLIGCDTYETQRRVRQALGDERARVACIGVAGEKLVKTAAVINDHGRAAARTGMGAVMGAKNLKAIAVRGSAAVQLADAEMFRETVKQIAHRLNDDLAAQAMKLAGTAGYVNMGLMYGDMPIRYFQQGEWEAAENLSGVLMAEQYQNRNTACFRCPIACGRETRAPGYQLEKVDGPEYETVAALGSLLMIDNLEAVIMANHLCNLYGMDTISTGCTIALACELSARGVLSPADTDGIEIRYGNTETLLRLVEKTARREGFGDVLAEGSASLAERFGVPDLAVTVKRLEVPMHDPRAFSGMAAIYALSPRGACHMQGDIYGVDTGQGLAPELGIFPGERFDSSQEKGRPAALSQAWRSLYNALILCQFQNPGVDLVLQALNAATGWDYTAQELIPIGKRIVTQKRRVNLRRGVTRKDDCLPKILLQPLEGGTEGNVPNLEEMLAAAYQEFGWDTQSGIPL